MISGWWHHSQPKNTQLHSAHDQLQVIYCIWFAFENDTSKALPLFLDLLNKVTRIWYALLHIVPEAHPPSNIWTSIAATTSHTNAVWFPPSINEQRNCATKITKTMKQGKSLKRFLSIHSYKIKIKTITFFDQHLTNTADDRSISAPLTLKAVPSLFNGP